MGFQGLGELKCGRGVCYALDYLVEPLKKEGAGIM
jgi:hypothetical protein